MKRRMGILAAILILTVQAGCSRAPASSQAAGGSATPQAASSRSVSSEIGLKPGETAAVTGEDNDFSLHGVDFTDGKTGWMIRDRYDSGSDSYRSQLLATADGGADWETAGADGRQLDAIRFTGSTEGWAVSEETVQKQTASRQGQVKYSVLHTSDGGATWDTQWTSGVVQKNNSLEAPGPVLWFEDAQSGYALVPGNLLKTADGGKTWNSVSFGIKDFSPVKLFFTDRKTGWAAGVSGKRDSLSVLHTADGGKSWTFQFRKKLDEGAAGCAGMDFLNAKEGWFLTSDLATWNGELYRTADGGRHWSKTGEIKSVRPTPEGLDFTDSQTGWVPLSVGAGPIAGGLSVTRDGGKTFSVLGDDGREYSEETRKVTSAREIVFQTERLGWAVGEDLNRGDFLLKTDDGGTAWTQIYPAPQPTVDFSFSDSRTGFGLGELSDPNAVLKTEDGGLTWKTVKSFTGSYTVQNLSFISPEEGWILAFAAGSSDGSLTVLHTLDGGASWSKLCDGPASDDSPACFRFFNRESGALITGSRVYRTSDGGKTWSSSAYGGGDSVISDQRELRRISGDKTDWKSPVSALKSAGAVAAALLPEGKGMLLTAGSSGDGVYELLTTSDAGKTWNPHPFKGVAQDAFDLLRDPCPMQFTDGAHGWILAAHGLLATADGGRSWTWR
ncbi:YCF48-related protein [Caproicibacter sp.]|uniref:YCF48-related protein n=1 Tax=Caproicibacter sp. TaxID=2814884 RepID=UPI003988DE87